MDHDITRILERCSGDPGELRRLLIPLVYESLKDIARLQMSHESRRITLQPTALVHEAYLRVFTKPASWQNRRHFFGAAAEAMRRILIEQARRRRRIRHGGQLRRDLVPLDGIAAPPGMPDILELDRALERLAESSPRKGAVIKLRYFLGLSIRETADLLDVSPATVKQDWLLAKAWLHREMTGGSR